MEDPITYVNDALFSYDEQRITECVKQTIGYCRVLLADIKNKRSDKPLTKDFIKSSIYDHMYILYYCFKCVGVIKLVSKMPVYDQVDAMLDQYMEAFFSSKDTHKMLSELKSNLDTEDDLHFINNLIDKCSKRKNFPELQKKIQKATDDVLNSLDAIEREPFELTAAIKQHIKIENYDQIILNRKNYHCLQRKITDPKLRTKLETVYLSKTDSCLKSLEKLIISRQEYAVAAGHATYFAYCKQKIDLDLNEILKMFVDLAQKIKHCAIKETSRIYKKLISNNQTNKVKMHDFIHYHNLLATPYLFSLGHILTAAITMVKTYFNIQLVESADKHLLWDSNVKVYKAIDRKGQLLGYIYMDLLCDAEKSTIAPICIHLCHRYTCMNNKQYDTKVCLLAGYTNYDDKLLKYVDAVAIFKEIGNAIQMLMYTTETGNMICADEFYTLTAKVMEYIFWEETTLLALCEGNARIVKSLLFTRYIDYANSMNIKCVNAWFDFLIHNLPDISNDIRKSGCDGHVVKTIYIDAFRNIMHAQRNIFETEINWIPQIAILQEVNGTETFVYEDVVIEFFGYGIFSAIKSGDGKKYLKILQMANTNHFKPLLQKLASKGGSYYDMYLHDVIGFTEIDTETNNTIKKEGPSVVTSDIDQKINITRKL